MITLSKITVSDKVSSWITLVNRIVDTIKLAVAPAYDEEGKLVAGNAGYMSMEDKKIINELPLTYMPIRGELPGDATWTKVTELVSSDALYVTVESNNVIVYKDNDDLRLEIVSAAKDEYSIKHLCFIPTTKDYVCTIVSNNEENKYVVYSERPPLVLKVLFIGGIVVISEEGFVLPEFKTINGESIIGSGNIDLLVDEDLKTINNESLIITEETPEDERNIKMLVESDFKTINEESIVGNGDISTLEEEDFKTINGESIVGFGDIDILVEGDFKTINDESIVGSGNIELLRSIDIMTINGESIIGTGNLVIDTLTEEDFKTINGSSIVGIGDITILTASDFKTINGQSIIGTGNIVIEGGVQDPQSNSRLGTARLGELVLGVKTIQDTKMAYTKQTFSDYQVLTADNMNYIEDGIETAHQGLEEKQDTLVSGTNIKTINGVSLLGEGNIIVEGGNGSSTITSYASDHVQIEEENTQSVVIPDSVKNYPMISVYHNGSYLVKNFHYTVEGDTITFINFTAFKNDIFAFVGVGSF